MKNSEASELIFATLKSKTTVTAQELNYESKGTLAFVQIYGIMSRQIANGAVRLNETDGQKKSYTLIDETKLSNEVSVATSAKEEKVKLVVKESKAEKSTQLKLKPSGRDLTTYKFNGVEGLNKGRLFLAIIRKYALDFKPTLKEALLLFPNDLVTPYGCIAVLAEAKRISKERARFFIKDEEIVKLKDVSICVSNQMNLERIAKIISIARKQLKYTIK